MRDFVKSLAFFCAYLKSSILRLDSEIIPIVRHMAL